MSGIALLVLAGRPAGGSLSVSSSPPFAYAGAVGGAPPFYSPSITAIAAGGSGSYTYAWTIVSSDGPVEMVSPASQTTSIRFLDVPLTQTIFATARCTVTDSVTGATGSAEVPAAFSNITIVLPF